MQAQKIVEVIKKAVLDVKAQQQEVISVDAMANYLDALKSDVEGTEVVKSSEVRSRYCGIPSRA